MSNVLPFRARTPRIAPRIALYRLSVTRAKALGTYPEPANETSPRASAADTGAVDDGLASLLELSLRAALESPRRTTG